MKCRMGPGNKAMLGTHVQCKEMQPLKMGKERKPHGKNPPPKKGKNKHTKKMMEGRKEGLNKTPQGQLRLEMAQETLSKP